MTYLKILPQKVSETASPFFIYGGGRQAVVDLYENSYKTPLARRHCTAFIRKTVQNTEMTPLPPSVCTKYRINPPRSGGHRHI